MPQALSDLRARLAKFTRRHSSSNVTADSRSSSTRSTARNSPGLKASVRSLRAPHRAKAESAFPQIHVDQQSHDTIPQFSLQKPTPEQELAPTRPGRTDDTLAVPRVRPATPANPLDLAQSENPVDRVPAPASPRPQADTDAPRLAQSAPVSPLQRQQSLFGHQQTSLINTLLLDDVQGPPSRAETLDFSSDRGLAGISANMVMRKIWVRRPGASATQVAIHEDDLVDDVREMILKKYANSLGKSFDSPDVTLRICPRENRQERILGPEEPMSRTLDAYFPGGQTVEEAFIIDVPLRRTPRPSPRGGPPHMVYYSEDMRPMEASTDYFPPMPATLVPRLPNGSTLAAPNSHPAPHSMSVLTTGHVPSLPSPGGGASRRHQLSRPRIGRQHTSSPTILAHHTASTVTVNNGMSSHARIQRSRTHSSASEKSAPPAPPPQIPTPPTTGAPQIQQVATPPPRVSSPRLVNRQKKSKKNDIPALPAGMISNAVPPINVLIVEDNIINLQLLEAFMKRLKVRWQTAMNGRDAVIKWRTGGFHLVLMDIQLPVMNGLQATREIRRLERLNSIGVFSSSASSSAPETDAKDEAKEEDKLLNTLLFKSPVIIVALTASSLQSDRHEALAAGCNDFLTKVREPLPRNTPAFPILTIPIACQLCLARAESYGMGLHAGTN